MVYVSPLISFPLIALFLGRPDVVTVCSISSDVSFEDTSCGGFSEILHVIFFSGDDETELD